MSNSRGRVDWADYAKGFCIIMVVMMHSTLGVEEAAGREGFMHAVVAFAKPFRMPDFFLISGLFLSRVIDRDWRTYLDRKVVHFGYFYVLWVTIQFGVKAPLFRRRSTAGPMSPQQYALAFIDPFGTLWFIYLLPIFFVVAKATRRPAAGSWFGWSRQRCRSAQIDTGWTAIDEFAGRLVYFYTGYIMAPQVFALAAAVQAPPARGAAWPCAVGRPRGGTGLCGAFGAARVVARARPRRRLRPWSRSSALMARAKLFDPVRYCGEHSIVIYLAFFLPMAVTRSLLLRTGIIGDVGVMAIVITAAGVVGALAWWWAARNTRASFLFERPRAFWLAPPLGLQPAE